MRKSKFLMPLFLFAVGSVTASHAVAEGVSNSPVIVVFKNGDVLSGKMIHSDEDIVEIESAALGGLKIHWTDVTEVRTKEGVLKAPTRVVQKAEEHTASGMLELAKQKRAPTPPETSISVSLNAPESVAIGTESQYVFGGSFGIQHNLPNLCALPSWEPSLLASANHNKSFEKGGAATVTDTYDGTLSLSNKLGSTQLAGYGLADVWGNSSLGVGLQQSYGIGVNRMLHTNACDGAKVSQRKGHRLEIEGKADVRYVHQRLYSPGGSHDLAGLHLGEDLEYELYRKDKNAKSKTVFSITQSLWVTPMLNNGKAFQAGGDLQLAIPINESFSIGFDERDDFVNNAPLAKRKNYLQSSITIKYTFPPQEK